jgi:hypothetical protein
VPASSAESVENLERIGVAIAQVHKARTDVVRRRKKAKKEGLNQSARFEHLSPLGIILLGVIAILLNTLPKFGYWPAWNRSRQASAAPTNFWR